jgi:hypothetical protein
VLSRRRARRIEEALLRDQHERPLGVATVRDVVEGGGHLGEGAAQVDGPRAPALGSAPRNRTCERVVHLENPRTGPEGPQLAPVVGRQAVSGDALQRRRRGVEQIGAQMTQLLDRLDPLIGHELTAARTQRGHQGLGELLRPAARERPPGGVGGAGEDEGHRRGERLVERDHGVRGEPGDERAGLFGAEGVDQAARGPQRRDPEPGEEEWMARQMENRLEGLVQERAEACLERRDQPAVGGAVLPQGLDGVIERPREDRRAPVIERVRQREVRVNPLEPMRLQVQLPEEG